MDFKENEKENFIIEKNRDLLTYSSKNQHKCDTFVRVFNPEPHDINSK